MDLKQKFDISFEIAKYWGGLIKRWDWYTIVIP